MADAFNPDKMCLETIESNFYLEESCNQETNVTSMIFFFQREKENKQFLFVLDLT